MQIILPYLPKSLKSSQMPLHCHWRETTVIVKEKDAMSSILNLVFRRLLEQKPKL